jgi:cysteinyl-tRNA synthetase
VPKPETKLFGYLIAIAWLNQQLQSLIRPLERQRVLQVRQRIADLIAPRSDKLEMRVQDLIDARNAARAAKNFQEADRIRKELDEMGIALKDTKDGTTWEIAP